MRLQKYIAQSGITSRRKAEELILQGKIKVNDKIVRELGTKVNPDDDIIKVNNKTIKLEKNKIYIMLNKPEGYVTTLKSHYNDKIVLDLINDIDERIFPIGRLDKDTSGLLLMTNDGNLAFKLSHPRYEILKKYLALVEGVPNAKKLNRFRKGLMIDGKVTSKAYIRIVKKYKDTSLLEISIHEGRKRQVRKMCEYIRHPVVKLKRVAIAELELGNLDLGKWRHLTEREVKYLKSI
ncbi:pseudouridine synthase [Clostridium sp. Cult2]|uniref:pseudouridine synthase n=1 Tax=Clostridium sp. Cult2 TaxID=2079003 RepID=UPI001F28270F|nr:pseudouridine synthase [Clostridium sp. Cult2]MCF6465114.1 pseudouridine synthase [Clostridium sp. Cult2]